MKTQITPFLMFVGQAEAAIDFYLSLFEDAELIHITRYGADGPGAPGSVQLAELSLAGQRVRCTDSPVKHAFTFTPASSLFVDCTSLEQLHELVAKISEGGQALMGLGDYGFSQQFAWYNDRFGVSWQLNLPYA